MGNKTPRGAISEAPPDNLVFEQRVCCLLAIPFSSGAVYNNWAASVRDETLVKTGKDLFEGVDPARSGGTSVSWTKSVSVCGHSVDLNLAFARQPNYEIANRDKEGDMAKEVAEQLSIIRHRIKSYQVADGFLLLINPREAKKKTHKKTLQESLTSILHLGEIREKRKPVFIGFLGNFDKFAESVLDQSIAILSSFHVLQNFCGFYCSSPESYGDIYRMVSTCVFSIITARPFSTELKKGVPFLPTLAAWGSLKVSVNSASLSDIPKKSSTYVYITLITENANSTVKTDMRWKTKPGTPGPNPAWTKEQDNTVTFEQILESQKPCELRLELWSDHFLLGTCHLLMSEIKSGKDKIPLIIMENGKAKGHVNVTVEYLKTL
eukprot:TRINITY_DN8782_c0_g1_i1.p1 TRINITY_DN8782_c0_g1~~TRINITY_DN8782_c0_g1_i1.p1  ORF type:complete len:379 (+),score=59.74 TRINITY_DN8782_c0_g1_i1:140-1276(+)